jgi:catechol 2,3-dioxygenase-like lactoylglutathione lyase family enzyme
MASPIGSERRNGSMSIVLDHTVVPARDKEASARFFARIFGLKYNGPLGHFAPVKVNKGLTLDFDDRDSFESHHYAFRVKPEEFEAILARVKTEGIPYGSSPYKTNDMHIYHHPGDQGFYFLDPNSHVLEVITEE